jgi:transposase-like protein
MNGGFPMSHNGTRRHFSPQEKVAILRRHLLENVPVSQLCDEVQIAPSLFYLWQRDFFENGHLAFAKDRKAKSVEDAKDAKIQQLEAKVQRKNEVLAELMEEHTQLKKDLGEA